MTQLCHYLHLFFKVAQTLLVQVLFEQLFDSHLLAPTVTTKHATKAAATNLLLVLNLCKRREREKACEGQTARRGRARPLIEQDGRLATDESFCRQNTRSTPLAPAYRQLQCLAAPMSPRPSVAGTLRYQSAHPCRRRPCRPTILVGLLIESGRRFSKFDPATYLVLIEEFIIMSEGKFDIAEGQYKIR